MGRSLLLDTNIWLDLFFSERPASQEAINLCRLATERGYDLLVATESLKDFYYLAEREAKRLRSVSAMQDAAGVPPSSQSASAARSIAWAMLESLLECATVVGADQSDVWIAHKHRNLHDDFEDDLIIAAAVRSGAECLISNDAALVRHAPLAALSSHDWLALHGGDAKRFEKGYTALGS